MGPRIGRIQAVHIREEEQAIRADHLRDAGREPIVVTVTDLFRRDGIVFVDHRDGAERDEGFQGSPGVEIPAPLFGVARGKQHLGHRNVVPRKRILPGMGQPNLARCGGSLALVQTQRTSAEPEVPAAEGDRPGGHQHHFLSPGPETNQIGYQGLEPG